MRVPVGRSFLGRLRHQVHILLDRPRDVRSYVYHIGLFTILLTVVVLSSLPPSSPFIAFLHRRFPSLSPPVFFDHLYSISRLLTVLLFVEYAARIWAAGADYRFQGPKGRLLYILLPLNLLDVAVFSLSSLLFLSSSLGLPPLPVWLADLLRPCLLLRALHFDRHVHLRDLVVKVFTNCGYTLYTIFYLSLFAILLHAYAVNECEAFFREHNQTRLDTDVNNFGDGLWFALVTSLSIGYGDLFPKAGLCRLLTAANGYTSTILLFSLQTLVAVCITEQIRDHTLMRREAKTRLYSASLIQTWYRYHLCRRNSNVISNYSLQVCRKLWQAKQKLDRMRMEEKESNGTPIETRRRKIFQSFKKMKRQSTDALGQAFLKRGSLPGHLSDLLVLTTVTAVPHRHPMLKRTKTEASPQNSIEIVEGEVEWTEEIQTTPEMQQEPSAPAVRLEFGPLVSFVEFLLFGHFSRKLKALRLPFDEEKALKELAEGEENNRQQMSILEDKMEDMLGKMEVMMRPFERMTQQNLVTRITRLEKEAAHITERINTLNILATAIDLSLQGGGRHTPLPLDQIHLPGESMRKFTCP